MTENYTGKCQHYYTKQIFSYYIFPKVKNRAEPLWLKSIEDLSKPDSDRRLVALYEQTSGIRLISYDYFKEQFIIKPYKELLEDLTDKESNEAEVISLFADSMTNILIDRIETTLETSAPASHTLNLKDAIETHVYRDKLKSKTLAENSERVLITIQLMLDEYFNSLGLETKIDKHQNYTVVVAPYYSEIDLADIEL